MAAMESPLHTVWKSQNSFWNESLENFILFLLMCIWELCCECVCDYVKEYVLKCVYATYVCAQEEQKRASNPLELDLQAIMNYPT